MPEYTMGHEEVLPGRRLLLCLHRRREKTSQSGNPMIELRLLVKGPNGNSELRIFDHLVFAPRAYWKIDMFRVATGETLVPGQAVRFEAEDCIDREGKVWLKVETFEGRSRNKVEKYRDPKAENPPPANSAPQTPSPKTPTPKVKYLAQEFKEKGAETESDDIPF